MRMLFGFLCVLLLTSPARAEWWVAETDHFIIYSEGKAKETEEFAVRLQRFAMAMRTMQNMPVKPSANNVRLTIYRWGTVSDIARLAGDPSGSVAGFFIPRASGSVAFVPARETFNSSPGARGSSDTLLGAETILFHEYVHHFMMQYFPAAYPAWYIEGFAEVYATTQFRDGGVFRVGDPANHRGMQLFYDVHFPVKKLFEAKQKPDDARHYYSIGWLLTHYLTFSPGRAGQLKKYLTAVNQGTPSADAARQVFGDLDKLDDEVQRYKRSRLMGYEVKPAGYVAPQVKLRALGDAERAIIATRIISKRGVDKKSAPRVASEARTKAQPYPNDAFVQTALTEAEFDAGNLDAAKAAADHVLAVEPATVAAINYRGLIELKRAEKDKSRYGAAREWFVKANKLEPNNPEPLINNYLAFDRAGGTIPELAIIGLERAFELAPFDRIVRFLLARQLLREGRAKSARTVLSPVAFTPHGGKVKEAAEKVLASIDGNDLKTAIGLANEQIEKADDEGKEVRRVR